MPKPRILVVEDECLIAAVTEALLIDLGCEVVGPFDNVSGAVAAAQAEPITIAIMDVNLRGEMSWPVMDALVERGIPFVICSGYVGADMPELARYAAPMLSKPFSFDDIERFIMGVLAAPQVEAA